jgi:DNA-3-methyladenine glycosylase I
MTVKTTRCGWCGDDPLYVAYHDREWGVPERDPQALFERLMLESMQAGLSWYTILKKREHMRARFFDFDPASLASRGPQCLSGWLEDAGLVRHRGKLQALIGNAAAFLDIDTSRGFSNWLWSFVDHRPVRNRWRSLGEVPASTEVSVKMSRDLKKAGFRFLGPTSCYAFMQSVGMVNDHLVSCHRHAVCDDLQRRWTP